MFYAFTTVHYMVTIGSTGKRNFSLLLHGISVRS